MSTSNSMSCALAILLAAGLAPNVSAATLPQTGSSSLSVALATSTVERLRQKVLVQCGISSERDAMPWYFHFEFGRALLEAGDARRAVQQLAQSVELNPEPRADKRLYGMWFTDYLPYFQLADAHVRLGNWPCATQAWELSQASGETRTGKLDPVRVREVEAAVAGHGDAVGACDRHQLEAVAFVGG